MPKNLINELNWRNLIHQQTSTDLGKVLAEPQTIYAGFDPTADSLHVGHLLPLITLKRAALFGHKVIAIVGGATGSIGDPSGKAAERKLLDKQTIEHNVAAVSKQIASILPEAIILNNVDWFSQINVLDFLRDVGKDFSVNTMLARDAVKNRLDGGISFTEFAYLIFQAFDFMWLNDKFNCSIQIGGSDQFGNIVSGIDLIRRKNNKQAFGLTMPLITGKNGEKFGKTGTNETIWLDKNKTSVNDLRNFFFNADDGEIGKLLRFFSLMSFDEIEALDEKTATHPEKRAAQIALANEMCMLIHSEIGGEQTKKIKKTDAIGKELVVVLVEAGSCSSKSDARRQIAQRAVKVNNEIILNDGYLIKDGDMRITRGKRDKYELC